MGEQGEEEDYDVKCGICHDVFEECGHVYCKGCVETWVSTPGSSRDCPYCSRKILGTSPPPELVQEKVEAIRVAKAARAKAENIEQQVQMLQLMGFNDRDRYKHLFEVQEMPYQDLVQILYTEREEAVPKPKATEKAEPDASLVTCSWCASAVKQEAGVTIAKCRHPFCKECLVTLIRNSATQLVPCPVIASGDTDGDGKHKCCTGHISVEEIKQLLTPEDFQRFSRKPQGKPDAVASKKCRHEVESSTKAAEEAKPPSVNLTPAASICAYCADDLQPQDGMILDMCGCIVCTSCVATIVINSEAACVKCPVQHDDGSACTGHILDREVEYAVSQKRYEEYLSRSLKEPLEGMTDTTFKCKTPSCGGWCEIGEGSEKRSFPCPVCSKINCINCEAIHEGVDCAKYQEVLAKAREETGVSRGSKFDKVVEGHMQSGTSSPAGFHQLTAWLNNNSNNSFLAAINYFRSHHFATPDLVLDIDLCNRALAEANISAYNDELAAGEYPAYKKLTGELKWVQHMGENDPKHNERIACPFSPPMYWYQEITQFKFGELGFQFNGDYLVAPNFQTMIWCTTRKVGVGIAFTKDKKKVYVVAKFDGDYNLSPLSNIKKPVNGLPALRIDLNDSTDYEKKEIVFRMKLLPYDKWCESQLAMENSKFNIETYIKNNPWVKEEVPKNSTNGLGECISSLLAPATPAP